MTTNAEDTIRRRADGSIDTDFYLARGRAERSCQAHHLFGTASRSAGHIRSNLNRLLNVDGSTRGLLDPRQPHLG